MIDRFNGDFGLHVGSPELIFIAGPCVIESRELTLSIAEQLAKIARSAETTIIFKASYDKANRSSAASPRGVGLDEGLRILESVRREVGLPVLTDVHETFQVAGAASVVDVLQIPAFLCRQTDLIQAAAKTGKWLNVKKGQFMAPWDMRQVIEKVQEVRADLRLMLTERGTSFGYNRLVVDMAGLAVMQELGCPLIFDATHSAQTPGSEGNRSGGEVQAVMPLARAAVAVGVSGIFFETHPDPPLAASDAATMLPLDQAERFIMQLQRLHQVRMTLG